MIAKESNIAELNVTRGDLPAETAIVASPIGCSHDGFHEAAVRAKCILAASSYPALRKIHCEFQEGIMRLSGEVPTFHLKQIAQTLLRGVTQVRCIENNLRVG